jgi:hypothetical protein
MIAWSRLWLTRSFLSCVDIRYTRTWTVGGALRQRHVRALKGLLGAW